MGSFDVSSMSRLQKGTSTVPEPNEHNYNRSTTMEKGPEDVPPSRREYKEAIQKLTNERDAALKEAGTLARDKAEMTELLSDYNECVERLHLRLAKTDGERQGADRRAERLEKQCSKLSTQLTDKDDTIARIKKSRDRVRLRFRKLWANTQTMSVTADGLKTEDANSDMN